MSAENTANLTITGTLGPGVTNTAKLYPNVVEIAFEIERAVIKIVYEPPNQQRKIQYFDYDITATVTYTISAGVATITIT